MAEAQVTTPRSTERLPLSMHVQLIARNLGRRSCLMKDICAGGALLELRDTSGVSDIGLNRGDVVLIRMFLGSGNAIKEHELRARVAHIDGKLFGITFANPNEETLASMLGSASPHHKEEEGHLDVEGKRLLALLEKQLLNYCMAGFSSFFKQIDEALLTASDKAKSNTDQRLYFDAATAMRKQQALIAGHYVERVKLAVNQEGGNTKKDASSLALVDKEQFEEWLVVKVMASRAEGNCRHQLFGLQARLDELAHTSKGKQKNPFSPMSLCEAFQYTLQKIKPAQTVEKILYRSFEESMLSGLNSLYETMNQTLAHHNVLPDLSVVHYAHQADEEARKEAAHIEAATEADQTQKSEPSSGVNGSSLGTLSSQMAAGPAATASGRSKNAVNGQVPLSKEPPRNAAEFMARASITPQDRFAASQNEAKVALGSLKRLFDLQNGARPSEVAHAGGSAVGTQSEGADAIMPQVPYFELNDVQQTIPQLKEAGTEWRSKLDTIATENGTQIAGTVLSILQMTEGLLQTLSANLQMGEHAKKWFRKLELPVLHSMMNDEDIFQVNDHPARKVLNQLARLGFKDYLLNKNQIASLDKLVDKIGQDFDSNPAIFQQALGALDPFVAKQEQSYQRNLERVRQLAEGEHKLESARECVNAVLDEKLAGKKVPVPIMSLLEAGWHDLLIKTYLRQGDESAAWHEYIGVISELLAIGADVHRAFDLREILRLIKTGLQEVTDMAGRPQQQVVKDLKHLLGGTQRLLGDVQWIQLPAKKQEDDKDLVEDRWLKKWMERARRMQTGEWMELRHRGAEPERFRLAWRDTAGTRFVFVNHQGVKVNDFSLRELATLMHTGNVLIFEGDDIPVVDDALEKVVHQLYEKLSWQAMHDELTGLINRAEFMRRLENALEQAKRQRARHVLVYINIDQFKVINNNAGLETGDKLLKEVAALLNKPMAPKMVAARISGDSFAILIEDCDLGKAQQLISMRLGELQATKFEVDAEIHRLTASAGMIDMTYTSNTTGRILHAAEEACSQAKTDGGNRIQVYQPDSEELQRRDNVMSWITKLNQALEDERLTLRCQKIQAIDPKRASEELPHYEVLLGMRTEEGEDLPPSEFVQAAERYNRMLAVDRWVVDNTLGWFKDRPTKFDGIGMISINLSGHSLTDPQIMSYVLDKLLDSRVPPQKICFEITETTAITNMADAAELMNELRKIGCRFALDDFGVGHGTYHYLKYLPLDFVKIDGGFVKDIAVDNNDYIMVRSINDLAHYMGLQTIAEYVENDQIMELLAGIGVDYAQGYGVEKPRWLDSL